MSYLNRSLLMHQTQLFHFSFKFSIISLKMDKNLIPGSKFASSFETSAPFNIETAKINKPYLIKFLIVIALLTSQFGKNLSV